VIIIWTAVAAFLKPQAAVLAQAPGSLKPPVSAELRAKGAWLKRSMEAKRYYEYPELRLANLAEKLGLTTHELSKIINTVLKKNFNDFINEYRVREVARKMQDTAYDNITLMGIAYESGFNSQTTFTRILKQVTGKSPTEFKNELKKDYPSYNMDNPAHFTAVISNHQTTPKWAEVKLNRRFMLRNYLKIAWRNLARNKTSSFINIGGLAVGMAVAMLIGLWIWDELTYDHYHKNHDRLAQVMTTSDRNGGELTTGPWVAAPLGNELRAKYGSDFKDVAMASPNQSRVLTLGDKKITAKGMWVEANLPSMLTLKMLKGDINGLKDPTSILLSASVAQSLFGDAYPINKVLRVDNQANYKVTGVYEDLPHNTTLNEAKILLPWDKYVNMIDWVKEAMKDWDNRSFNCYVQLSDHVDFNKATARIKLASMQHLNAASDGKEELLLQPMNNWRLYSEFKNGKVTGGRIKFVNLFATIGIFVLLLACINFMNLSTARSKKRSKEVGIRKTVGSLKSQLVSQFLIEAMLIAGISFLCCLLFAQLLLPLFNTLSDKQMTLPFSNVFFWILSIGFTIITGLLAGCYPAFYLSHFDAVKVLKGTYRVGRFASLPRKVLVVVQFSVSIILVIGTITVYKQIQFAKNRPVGYNRESLIAVYMTTPDLYGHYEAMRNDLLATNVVENMAESGSPVTNVWTTQNDYSWQGMNPAMQPSFGTISVTPDYGKTINWQVVEGRDLSRKFSDFNSVILNEAAVKLTGIKNIVGKTIKKNDKNLAVVGVVKDMVMESPYASVTPTIFLVDTGWVNVIYIRMKAGRPVQDALTKIAKVFEKYNPAAPFDYTFTDEEYAQKFSNEQRIGNLAAFFAVLAIFISCIGLFGMASFMAEQRIKEIGVRKVLGASVFGLWRLLSGDFTILVIISLFVAIPAGWWAMYNWLQNYTYRTSLSWWVFAIAGLGALLITLLTVSYQSIKAALANPVNSLRSE
ncbi:MAG TPA: ABC transporter permease, partial [Chitinophagaceae bacterium]|nr:ABC transporter permease [Chitinophagaceae bacterium]